VISVLMDETIHFRVLNMLFYPLIHDLHSERDTVLAPKFEWSRLLIVLRAIVVQ